MNVILAHLGGIHKHGIQEREVSQGDGCDGIPELFRRLCEPGTKWMKEDEDQLDVVQRTMKSLLPIKSSV
jgi:hypothetical protein